MKDPFKFKKILVALDMSNMDKQLIKYSQFVAKNAGAREVQFVHVIPNIFLPGSSDSAFQKVLAGKMSIEHWVQRYFTKKLKTNTKNLPDVKIGTKVLAGHPLRTLISEVEKSQPDLFILGNKTISAGSGIIARRIARKAKCAVCFVTESSKIKIKNILVPIDFSENSAKAIQAAVQLQKKNGKVHIAALHVIEVPMTAYKINRNQNKISSQLVQSADEKFVDFLKKYKIANENIELITEINDVFNVSTYIQKVASEKRADLIIMGAKGHSLFKDFIFGSTVEKLVTLDIDDPILIVR